MVQLTLNTGLFLRDQALEALEGKYHWFLECSLPVLHELALKNSFLTSDDLWRVLNERDYPVPGNRRVISIVFRRAMFLGWLERTEATVTSNRAVCHARPIRVWRSLIVQKGGVK